MPSKSKPCTWCQFSNQVGSLVSERILGENNGEKKEGSKKARKGDKGMKKERQTDKEEPFQDRHRRTNRKQMVEGDCKKKKERMEDRK